MTETKTHLLIKEFQVKDFYKDYLGYTGIPQLMSERIICKQKDPSRAKAYLFWDVLCDQVIHHYHFEHYDFEKEFPFPKLISYHHYGCLHPSWFIREFNNHHENVDWIKMKEMAEIILPDVYNWIKDNCRGLLKTERFKQKLYQENSIRQTNGYTEEQIEELTKILDNV